MNLDFTDPFTMEVCQATPPRERSLAPGSRAVASEIAKQREHERAVESEYTRLNEQFGNPRRELLKEIRSHSAPEISTTLSDGVRRVVVMNGRLADSAEQIQQQRAEIIQAKDQKTRRTAANKSKASRLGIPSIMVDDDEQTRRGLELLGAGSNASTDAMSAAEDNET